MRFILNRREDNLTELQLSGRLTSATTLAKFREFVEQQKATGSRAAIIDLSKVTMANASGLAALVEWAGTLRGFDVALINPTAQLAELIEKLHVGDLLPLYPSMEAALTAPGIRGARLAGCRAVVLCAGRGTRMGPLSNHWPKPMIDICGRPLLDHILRHLAGFGISQVFTNPCHLGIQIPTYFNAKPVAGQTMFYVNEVTDSGLPDPCGSASTLRNLHRNHSAFDKDFFVLCGDALIDIDLADMMTNHKRTGADITIATLPVPREDVEKYGIVEVGSGGRITSFQEKPTLEAARSTLANTGIYIFNPRVLKDIHGSGNQDIGHDLLPLALAQGRRLHVYAKPFRWNDVGCGKDYVATLAAVLTGQTAITPTGTQRREGLWVDPGAQIGRMARIDGPCFIGANAHVASGARITGPCAIGANCVIERGAMLKDCVILPGTHIKSGAMVDRVITGPSWAIDHRYATGTNPVSEPLDGVEALQSTLGMERSA